MKYRVPDTRAYVINKIAYLRDATPKLRDAGKEQQAQICESDLEIWKAELDELNNPPITGTQLYFFSE